MRITTPRGTLVAGLLGLLVVAAAAWLLLVGPATGRLADARSEHADTVDANRLLAVRLHAAERQQRELATTEAAADELAAMFPAVADQPGFFRALDRVAREAGIDPDDVTTLSPTVPTTAAELAGSDPAASAAAPLPDLAVQTVTVSVEAPYEKVQALLAGIERMDRAFLVRDVSVTSTDGTTTAEVVGNVFLAPRLTAPEDGR